MTATIATRKTNESYILTCKDCNNFDGTICDYTGLLCMEDDIPRCGGEGFEPFTKEGYFGKRAMAK